jgi:hypothetical protein
MRRYMAAMINEGANVVHEGIALRPLDVDVTFIAGYGFPRHRGGPMKYADTVGLPRVLADIRGVCRRKTRCSGNPRRCWVVAEGDRQPEQSRARKRLRQFEQDRLELLLWPDRETQPPGDSPCAKPSSSRPPARRSKSHRGEFNITPGPTLAAFAVQAAVERSGMDPALIEDAILGCGYPEGIDGAQHGAPGHRARRAAAVGIAGVTVSRFCASGLQAIAMAAGRIVADGVPAMIAGGVESISQIRSRSATDSGDSGLDPWIVEHKPELYMSMIDTADIVAARYGISREAQDRFSAGEPAQDRGGASGGPLPRRDRAR